jgi:hypothetical protein
MLRCNFINITIGFISAMTVVGLASIAAGDVEGTASHVLFVDEYRCNLCDHSDINFVPSPSMRVTADGKCNKAQAFGNSEGTTYLRAVCTEDGVTGIYSGNVQLAYGSTLSDCENAELGTVKDTQCYDEHDFFPVKPESELQYLRIRCFSAAVADACDVQERVLRLVQHEIRYHCKWCRERETERGDEWGRQNDCFGPKHVAEVRPDETVEP